VRERDAWLADRLLLGVDEVGRGPIAGPVVAAAIVFRAHCDPIPGVRDSKTVPAERRDELAGRIRGVALALGVGGASCREIARHNIRVATAIAMRRAIDRCLRSLHDARVSILVDGLPVPELGHGHAALVDGDALCYSVAAAGLVAKTVRDRLMRQLAVRHPGYGWQTNMGYGTAEHMAGLQAHGVTRHHRETFAPIAELLGR
jgi:ribonuclease HII